MKSKGLLITGCLILLVVFKLAPGIGNVKTVLGYFAGSQTESTDNIWHTETVPVDVPAYLNANTSGGFITVEPHDRDNITIEVLVKKNGRYLKEGDKAPVKLTINDDANGVEIGSKVDATRRWLRRTSSVSVSYRIFVPRETEIRANTSGGYVSATGIEHNVSLITSGGRVSAENVTGDVLARTSGGPITIQQVSGDLSARTSGGGIRVADVTGNIDVRTSGGPIRLKNAAGRIEAHTSGGSVNAHIASLRERLILKTSGGSISASLPANQGMDIIAEGSSIRNNLEDLTGTFERSRVEGSVKGGGIPVEIRTSGGGVRLDYTRGVAIN